MGSVNELHAFGPDTVRLRKLIEDSLLSDWVIRIEYGNGSYDSDWLQWGDTIFAIRSAEPVLDAIVDCYNRNSNCPIRLHAEKVRPQTRMLYTVSKPQVYPTNAVAKPEKSIFPHLGASEYLPLQPELATSG